MGISLNISEILNVCVDAFGSITELCIAGEVRKEVFEKEKCVEDTYFLCQKYLLCYWICF
jgi:hypothetical protein